MTLIYILTCRIYQLINLTMLKTISFAIYFDPLLYADYKTIINNKKLHSTIDWYVDEK